MSDTLIVFGSFTLMVCVPLALALYFRARNRRTVLDAIRLITERGEPVAPELIAALVQDKASPYADLRRGVVFLSIAVATGVFAVVLGEGDSVRPLLGIAAFPGLIGLAYIGLHFFASGARATRS
ncbi:MAG: hypothetical protein KGO02_11060 [Alphaproteobacteria bacterium]|nr:hypothetical protein [Alphaproteobacteria bacterium]